MKKGFCKVLFVFLLVMVSILSAPSVYAASKNIEVLDINIKDKSGTITVNNPTISDGKISGGIKFNEIGDFVTFELVLKNNEADKYKIAAMKDNNESENIGIEYTYGEDFIGQGEETRVTIKMIYKKKLLNQDKISLNNLSIKLELEKEDGTSSEITLNPNTGDSILKYVLFFILSGLSLLFVITKKRIKEVKIGVVLLVISIIVLPFVAMAKEKFEFVIKFADIVEVKGEFEKYNITINPENGSKPITREVTYGQPIRDLPDVSKEGYDFDKWVDGKGNKVTKETIITGPIEIEAKYNVIKYDITYNLNGGKLSTGKTNPSKYTIENDAITLNNPSKDGYTFTGWTGTGIDTKTTSVTIEAGSTGNRKYTANYSANENTPYKVIHRYKNLNETYTEEEVTEYGETDKKIDAPIKSKKGFVNPSVQEVTVKADGTSKVTYTYEREKYNFSISDRTYIDNSSTDDGKYPYETEIKVKAIERDGYDFAWSDGKTELKRTFKIDENTTLTPVYTAKTNIPYKVIHQKQKLSLNGYDIVDTQYLNGTTGTSASSSANSYTGFKLVNTTSTPSIKIEGDGSTVITYFYDRISYTLSFNNSEYVDSTKNAGSYPYETKVTVTAKTREGYTFNKWSNNNTSNPYTFTITNNTTIEPVYDKDPYIVTFNGNGGTSSVASVSVPDGESIAKLPTAERTNYTFVGWFTAATDGVKVSDGYTPNSNTTLYAHWTKKGKISYNTKTITKVVDSKSFKNSLTNTGSSTNINYTSSNEKVAIVDSSGNVNLVGVGTATITAKVNDSSYTVNTASYTVVAEFNYIAYSKVDNDHTINSKEHFNYAVGSNAFTTIKTDLQPTKDGGIILCHDPGFTFDSSCDIEGDLTECRIVAYDKKSEKTVNIINMTTSLAKSLKYKNGDSVATLDDYINIMKNSDKKIFLTVRDNIVNKISGSSQTYVDVVLSKITSDIKDRTIINSLSYEPLVAFRNKDNNIMLHYVVGDSDGEVDPSSVDKAKSLGNTILSLFIFRSSHVTARNNLKDGKYADIISEAQEKGIPVYVATNNKADVTTYLKDYLIDTGISGAQVNEWLE